MKLDNSFHIICFFVNISKLSAKPNQMPYFFSTMSSLAFINLLKIYFHETFPNDFYVLPIILKNHLAGHWWLMPVIPATQEAAISRISGSKPAQRTFVNQAM
jgi:hypothetical protein